jgi:Zn-dependent alcohol dehydrogenase
MTPYLMEAQSEGKFPLGRLLKIHDSKDFHEASCDMREGKVLKPVLRWM